MNRLIILFFVCVGTVQAQNIKFTLGPALGEQPDQGFAFFNNATKKAYWMGYPGFIARESGVFQLDDYIKKGPVYKSLKFPAPSKKQDILPEGYYTRGEKNYVLYSVLDKERDEHTVFTQEFSAAITTVGSPTRMVTFKNNKVQLNLDFSTGVLNLSGLQIAYSSDHIFFVKKHEDKLEVKVYSFTSGELETKIVTLEPNRDFSVGRVTASKTGTLFISGTYVKGDKMLDPFLAVYSPVTKDYKMHVIKSGNKTDDIGYTVRVMDDGTAFYAGLYNVAKETGYKLYKVNESLGLDLLISKQVNEVYSDVVYKGAYTPDFFGISDILQLDNGNVIVDIEGGAGSHMKHASSYYSSPVYLACIGSDKIEKWATVIHKYQAQPLKSDLLGHVTLHKNNSVYILYNDDLDNFNLLATDKPKEGLIKKNMYVATVEIDETGKAKKLKLITTDKNQTSYFRPWDVRKIDSNLFHFLFKKDEKFYFGTLAAKG